ncbi:MAG: TatD DNase family protein [Bacteroidia bacterium]|jgi:TatD DNase family protein
MDLIDIGCNLTHDTFDPDRDEVIAHAVNAGVVQMVVTGASAQGSNAAFELARSRPGQLFATAGVHPHHASQYSGETDRLLRELCEKDEVVAAGETGLDYFRDLSPRQDQIKAFESQLQIGADTGLPLFLHLRDAHVDFHPILKSWRHKLSDLVVHCFTGTREELTVYLDLDCYVGITGWICDERRGSHMKEFMTEIPSDRLMIETDAPYLKPRNLTPKVKSNRNEPQWLPWILTELANSRSQSPEQLALQTTENARRFFRLPTPDNNAG